MRDALIGPPMKKSKQLVTCPKCGKEFEIDIWIEDHGNIQY